MQNGTEVRKVDLVTRDSNVDTDVLGDTDVVIHRHDDTYHADNELSDTDSEPTGIDNAAYLSNDSLRRLSSGVSMTMRNNMEEDIAETQFGESPIQMQSTQGANWRNGRYTYMQIPEQSNQLAEVTPTPPGGNQRAIATRPSNVVPSRRGWNHRQAEISSVIHLFCALFAFTFGLLLLGLPGIQTSYSKAGHGMWSGAIFGITGAIGLKAAHIKTAGSITALLIMCVLSGMCCFIILFLEAYSLTRSAEFYGQYESKSRPPSNVADRHVTNRLQVPSEGLVLLHVALILVSIVEFSASVWLFVISATATCCPTVTVRDVSIIYSPAS